MPSEIFSFYFCNWMFTLAKSEIFFLSKTVSSRKRRNYTNQSIPYLQNLLKLKQVFNYNTMNDYTIFSCVYSCSLFLHKFWNKSEVIFHLLILYFLPEIFKQKSKKWKNVFVSKLFFRKEGTFVFAWLTNWAIDAWMNLWNSRHNQTNISIFGSIFFFLNLNYSKYNFNRKKATSYFFVYLKLRSVYLRYFKNNYHQKIPKLNSRRCLIYLAYLRSFWAREDCLAQL